MQRLLADAEKLSGVKYDIGNLGDVYSAIHVVQGELGLTGVAAEEASTTLTGSFNAMKASAMNFLGSLALGENVGKSLSGLITSGVNFAFGNLIPMIGEIVMEIPGAVITFLMTGLPALSTALINFVNSIGNKISAFADGLTSKGASKWLANNSPKIINAVGSVMIKLPIAILKNLPKIALAIAKIGNTIIVGLGSAIWGKVSLAAKGIFNRFLAPIRALMNKVRAIVNRIKGFFRFKISAPRIPLPHFGISPAGWKLGDLLKGSIPRLRINWRAKGGVFDNPELIGAGEAGREILTPEKLLRQITAESSESTNAILMRILSALVNLGDSEQSIEFNGREFAKIIRSELETLDRRDRRKLGHI